MVFIKVAGTSDIPIGTMKRVRVLDTDVLVANVGGTFHAIGNKCTHMGGMLAEGKLEGNTVICPRHGSKFDVTTGVSIQGPKIGFLRLKTNNEPSFNVKVEGPDILVDVG